MPEEAIFLDSAGSAQMGICAGDNAKLEGVDTEGLLQTQAIRQRPANKSGVGSGG